MLTTALSLALLSFTPTVFSFAVPAELPVPHANAKRAPVSPSAQPIVPAVKDLAKQKTMGIGEPCTPTPTAGATAHSQACENRGGAIVST